MIRLAREWHPLLSRKKFAGINQIVWSSIFFKTTEPQDNRLKVFSFRMIASFLYSQSLRCVRHLLRASPIYSHSLKIPKQVFFRLCFGNWVLDLTAKQRELLAKRTAACSAFKCNPALFPNPSRVSSLFSLF